MPTDFGHINNVSFVGWTSIQNVTSNSIDNETNLRHWLKTQSLSMPLGGFLN